MKLPWIVGGAAVLCCTFTLFARQGMVTTQDGKQFEGDVTDRGTTVEIVPDPKKPGVGKITLQKAGVKDIVYADRVGEQVKQRLTQLDKRDVRGRIVLAQFAMKNGAYEAARDVLEDARAIEPGNQEVQTLLQTANAHINMGQPAAPASQPAATRPAGGVAAATQPSEAPKREVTAEEINRIKQLEWNRKDPITVRIDNDVKNNYVRSAAMTPAEFQRLPKEQQAIQILDNGKPEWAAGVHIMNDPISVAEYHKIQRVLTGGCAASGCHGDNNPKGGNFHLFVADNPVAYYTNFLTLQTFVQKVGDVPRAMIDRDRPEESLLLQYMLPIEIAKTAPHPKAANYKGVVKSVNDPRYQQVHNWVLGLGGVRPDYAIDLTKEAPKKETDPKKR